MSTSQRVNVRLPQALAAYVFGRAQREDRPVARIVCEAIRLLMAQGDGQKATDKKRRP
jgi:hypothetical protein